MGTVRDLYDWLFCKRTQIKKEGYGSLLNDWQDFYTRRLYNRIQDCFNRPINSAPGAWVSVMQRDFRNGDSDMVLTGSSVTALNLSSYNYLGFAESELELRTEVCASLWKFGVSSCSSRSELGTTTEHLDLENRIAKFLGKEAAMICGMGFGCNSFILPALMGRDDLILSDELNHSSIVTGSRLSEATVRVFRHNCPKSLERELRRAISRGKPRTYRPWKRIMVCTEGLFSMEGELCALAEISRVCKKYKAYLYVDEAHSIGALGNTGRGIAEHAGVDPKDVDIFMGTFTKSFGSVGGYIASTHEVIHLLKRTSPAHMQACSMSVACIKQASLALQLIQGEDGTDRGQKKLDAIKENANMFRDGLKKMGLQVIGDYDSPVVPALLFNPAKIPAFSRECLARKLAVVVVGFPATPLLKSRIRFCISAAHSKKDLISALKVIEQVSAKCMIQYKRESYWMRINRWFVMCRSSISCTMLMFLVVNLCVVKNPKIIASSFWNFGGSHLISTSF